MVSVFVAGPNVAMILAFTLGIFIYIQQAHRVICKDGFIINVSKGKEQRIFGLTIYAYRWSGEYGGQFLDESDNPRGIGRV